MRNDWFLGGRNLVVQISIEKNQWENRNRYEVVKCDGFDWTQKQPSKIE